MVATGVADRARNKVKQLIYIDAFVPDSDRSLLDFLPESERLRMREGVKSGDGWRVPPNPTSPDTPPEDVAWLNERRVHMPLQCLEQPLKLSAPLSLPRSYIYATRISPADVFGQFAKMAKGNPAAWSYYEMDVSHSPNVSAPEPLMAMLDKVVA